MTGSIVETIDGCFWYSCGNWSVNGSAGHPCMLGYVPERERKSTQHVQKTLDVRNSRLVKTMGIPHGPYSEYLSSKGSMLEGTQLGRTVFLKQGFVRDVRNPKLFLKRYIRKECLKEAEAVMSLMSALNIKEDDMGISGSSLMFDEPTHRHEVDFAVYGKGESRRVWKAINEMREEGATAPVDKYYQRFMYDGVCFDPQFSEGDGEKNAIDGCTIGFMDDEMDLEMKIEDDELSIFYPAIYTIDGGRKLISFRPGHRGLFENGSAVKFGRLKRVRIAWPDGTEDDGYAIIRDERGEILKGRACDNIPVVR